MTLTGAAQIAGLLGWPVGHSKSPRLHGYWIDRLGLDAAYVPLAVRPEDLDEVLKTLPKLGFRGVNLTLPHKERALALLPHIDPAARAIGAVNTIVVGEGGVLLGRNTDAPGFIANLRQGAPDFRFSGVRAVILGAGGAARAVLYGLLDAGALSIRLTNRNLARSHQLAEAFGPAVEVVAWEERESALASTDLVVNTTSLGMTGQPPLILALDDLAPTALVTDIVYTPLETALLTAARTRGNPVVDGLGMLLHQAVEGFTAWFGVRPEVTATLRRYVLSQG